MGIEGVGNMGDDTLHIEGIHQFLVVRKPLTGGVDDLGLARVGELAKFFFYDAENGITWGYRLSFSLFSDVVSNVIVDIPEGSVPLIKDGICEVIGSPDDFELTKWLLSDPFAKIREVIIHQFGGTLSTVVLTLIPLVPETIHEGSDSLGGDIALGHEGQMNVRLLVVLGPLEDSKSRACLVSIFIEDKLAILDDSLLEPHPSYSNSQVPFQF